MPSLPPTLATISKRYRWALGLALAGVISVAFVIMREIDSLLLMLASASGQRYGMTALAGLQASPDKAQAALTFWAQTAAATVDSGTGTRPFEWVRLYSMCDSVAALAYTPLLYFVLIRLGRPKLWSALAAGALLAADLIENAMTFAAANLSSYRTTEITAAIAADPDAPAPEFIAPAIVDHLYQITILKWVAVWITVAMILVGLLRTRLGWVDRPARSGESAACPSWGRVAWRLRVQISVIALLAFVMAVPSNDRLGALQQLPDVLRSYLAPRGSNIVATALSSLALLAIGAAIWISVRWQPFHSGPHAPTREQGLRWPYQLIGGLAVFWAVLFGVQMTVPVLLSPLGVSKVPPWATSWQVALPSLAAAGLLGAVWLLHREFGGEAGAPARIAWHPRYAAATNLLAVAPIVIGGLGLVRAAVGLALLPGASANGLLGVGEGIVVAVVLGPAALAVLTRLPAGPKVSRTTTIAVLAAAAAVVALLGIWPVQLGPWVGLPGIFALALAVIALGLGAMVALGLRTEGLALNRRTIPAGRPVALPAIALVIAVVAALTLTDRADTYHEVSYQGTGAAPVTRSLAGHFDAWRQAMASCGEAASPAVGTPPRVQPLVLVSAAGGGIRAAYWTEQALLQLTGTTATGTGLTGPEADAAARAAACQHDSVFVVSGVSGGSVGERLWSAHPVGTTSDATGYAKAISSQAGLSATGATWLFRDSVRTASGIDLDWNDRAWAMERVWHQQLAEVGVDSDAPFFPTDDRWHPIPLLNGTDLQTGCRVVIAPIRETAVTELPNNCQGVPHEGASLPGAYYASEFLETSQCATTGGHTISSATAALLSARFPYVTPTGLLYACGSDQQVVRVQVGDGGYLEPSGIHAALQVWRAIEPMVAGHNQAVLDDDPATPAQLGDAVIVPVFVVVGNSYRSGAGSEAAQYGELLAPLAGRDIAAAGMSPPRLETEVRAAFSRPIPGTDQIVSGAELATRVVVIAPTLRPEITAPLGWALSEAAQYALDDQIRDQAANNAALQQLRLLMPGTLPAGTELIPAPPPPP